MSFGRNIGFASAILVFFSGPVASAYISTVTSSGQKVKWGDRLKLELVGNPQGRTAMSSTAVYDAVARGLQRWNAATQGRLRFDYWQGIEPSRYPTNSEFNGISSIYFASAATSSSPPGLGAAAANVLGLTQVWYNVENGEIFETDIQLNDLSFDFTDNPQDTSGSGIPTAGLERNKVFLENVITHELGHAFGLSHSGTLQSTMLFMESPEQAHLSCDELIGINAHYFGVRQSYGAIRGRVLSEQGVGVFGAHVQAVARRRGTVLAGALTGPDGDYQFEGLEPGDYFLVAEPFRAGVAALPTFYEGMNTHVCGGKDFSRTFLHAEEFSRLSQLEVKADGTTTAPDLRALCVSNGAAAVSSMPTTLSMLDAPALTEEGNKNGFGFTAEVRLDRPTYHRLNAIAGHLEVRALSYSLYSPVKIAMSLLNTSGEQVEGAIGSESVYRGESGYVNFDSALISSDLPFGDYVLKMESTAIEPSLYPAGLILMDAAPFVLISGSLNESEPVLARELPFNARCDMKESFARYDSPLGNPPSSSSQPEEGGSCLTIRSRHENRRDNGAFFGWLISLSMMIAGHSIVRWRCRLQPVQEGGTLER